MCEKTMLCVGVPRRANLIECETVDAAPAALCRHVLLRHIVSSVHSVRVHVLLV